MPAAKKTDWGYISQLIVSWGFFAGASDNEVDPTQRSVMRAIYHALWFAEKEKRMTVKKNGIGGIVFCEKSTKSEYKCRHDGSSCVIQRDELGDVIRTTELAPAIPLPQDRL